MVGDPLACFFPEYQEFNLLAMRNSKMAETMPSSVGIARMDEKSFDIATKQVVTGQRFGKTMGNY